MADWTPTPESSHVAAIKYEPDTQDLFVEFTDGSQYQYFDVPQNVFDEFSGHTSKGRYVNIVLRRRYKYQKIG